MTKHITLFTWLAALATLSGVVSVGAAAKKPGPAPANGWSGASAISAANQPDPTRGSQLNDVAVNANGLALAAWDQFTYNGSGGATIGAAVQSGGRWGAPFTVSGTAGFSTTPRVAVGPDGTMAITWTYLESTLSLKRIQVAVKPSNASTWTTSTLDQGASGGVALTEFVPVAIDAAGNVTAAWTRWDGTRHLVRVATRLQGGTWSAPTTVSGPNTDGLFPSLSVNSTGHTAIVYSLSPWASYLTGTWAEFVSRSAPGDTWTTPLQISEQIPSSVGYVMNPQVALDAAGLATVIYMGRGVEAVRETPTTWTPPATVVLAPNAVSSYLSPDLGIDGRGNAVVAVSVFDASIGVDRASVYVARGTPDGVWSPPQRITDPTVPVDAYATRVAVSPDRSLAMVGWIDHYHGTVQVATLGGGVWGAANTIGRGTAWSSFQETLGLDVGSGTVARAVWKDSKSGTQTMASSYGR